MRYYMEFRRTDHSQSILEVLIVKHEKIGQLYSRVGFTKELSNLGLERDQFPIWDEIELLGEEDKLLERGVGMGDGLELVETTCKVCCYP